MNIVYSLTHHVYQWILPSLRSLAEHNPEAKVYTPQLPQVLGQHLHLVQAAALLGVEDVRLDVVDLLEQQLLLDGLGALLPTVALLLKGWLFLLK